MTKEEAALGRMKPNDRGDPGQANPKQEIVITGHISVAPMARQTLG